MLGSSVTRNPWCPNPHLFGRAAQGQPVVGRPGGRLVFRVFGALPEFERELIRERTMAGFSAARARGRSGGRPAKMTPTKIARARELYSERRLTVDEIAKSLDVSRASIYRHVQTKPAP